MQPLIGWLLRPIRARFKSSITPADEDDEIKRNNFKTKKKRTIPLALLMIVLVCVAVWAPTITGIVMVNHIGKYPITEPFFLIYEG